MMDARKNDKGILFVVKQQTDWALKCAPNDNLKVVPVTDNFTDTGDSWSVFPCKYIFGRLTEQSLLLVTEWRMVAKHPIKKSPIYLIESVRILSSNESAIGNETTNFIIRLINENGGFYVCPGSDLTQTLYRHAQNEINDDFTWNRYLWKKETDARVRSEFYSPIIRGFVEQKSITLDQHLSVEVTLIARRSVYMAGTRYLKRGIDENGHVANFVESEQIAYIADHCVSTVQIRGSVPVYWSQKGYRYRPPPTIDQPSTVSQPAFIKHMRSLLATYGVDCQQQQTDDVDSSPRLVCVSLIEQLGRESVLADVFLEHILHFDDARLTYVAFDYHAVCQNGRQDRIRSTLVNAIIPHIQRVGFTWLDPHGQIVSRQSGVIRTNCVDCLDRTNVVQTSIALVCLEQALYKVGALSKPLPLFASTIVGHLWADHGDEVSVQYAGTAALKGDVTRSGQRQLGGMLRDGYNSASRYYLSHVRDAQTQTAIDALLGRQSTIKQYSPSKRSTTQSTQLWKFVDSVQKICHDEMVNECGENVSVGSWPLITDDGAALVVVLTRHTLLVAAEPRDDAIERIPLQNLSRIELGEIDTSAVYMRVTLRDGRFLQWRAAPTRLFNNRPMLMKSIEEQNDFTRAIAEQIAIACSYAGLEALKIQEVGHLSRAPVISEHTLNQSAGVLFHSAIVQKQNKLQSMPTVIRSMSKSADQLTDLSEEMAPNISNPEPSSPAKFLLASENDSPDESLSASPSESILAPPRITRIASKGKNIIGMSKGIASSSFSKLAKGLQTVSQNVLKSQNSMDEPPKQPVASYSKYITQIRQSKSQIIML